MDMSADVTALKGVGPKKGEALNRLGIFTLYDLLTYFPRTYDDQSVVDSIAALRAGEKAVVCGTITAVSHRQASRRGMTIITAVIDDGTGALQLTWFNQRYLQKQLKKGKRVYACGLLSYAYGGRGQLAMSRISSFTLLDDDDEGTAAGILPIYRATEILTQKFFRKLMQVLLSDEANMPEVVPQSIMEHYHLISRLEAFQGIHFPESFAQLELARQRLAFEELYLIQCGLLLLKKQSREKRLGYKHKPDGELLRQVWEALPFQLTKDQLEVWNDIARDMERNVPMSRLVQGDVGSGKTVIAMLALVKTVENGHQGALMAPTEILAAQHYDSFQQALQPLGIRVALLSGRLTKRQREVIYSQLANHEIDIVIGTHALIQEEVHFADLGLAVTDEQHRFGVAQRAMLEDRGRRSPDVLVMTATPIPRTLTLTIYGDLDVSAIRHLPPGRRPIRTFLRRPDRRELIYKYVLSQLQAGRQAYVVCPLIEAEKGEDEAADSAGSNYSEINDADICGAGYSSTPSAEAVYQELSQGLFRGVPCGLVHGRMKSADKETVMQAFYRNEIKLLVATTVIEVGVNVPNASLMVIEQADRFGLSQLHQLRGRIGRGQWESFCILVSDCKSETAKERLQLMEKVSDGFQLAEEDLRLRGPGQFFGSLQHGMPDLKIANVLKDMDTLLKAREAAHSTIANKQEMVSILPTLALQYGSHFDNITDV